MSGSVTVGVRHLPAPEVPTESAVATFRRVTPEVEVFFFSSRAEGAE